MQSILMQHEAADFQTICCLITYLHIKTRISLVLAVTLIHFHDSLIWLMYAPIHKLLVVVQFFAVNVLVNITISLTFPRTWLRILLL